MSELSPEPTIHWKDMPEFHDIYMPWCDRVIESEPVNKIIGKVRADLDAIENSETTFMPNMNRLTTDIRTIELNGEPVNYQAAYSSSDHDEHITISLGDHYSIMLHPSRTGNDAYKIGMSTKMVRAAHVLLGSGHSYSPYPLISDAHQREYVEALIAEVAGDLFLPLKS